MESTMKHVAFIALLISCVTLEIIGAGAGLLWALLVIWAITQYL
jgi:hypothetical protein